MCGISVIINQKNKKIDQPVIKAMTDVIEHRGPDGEGFYHGHQFAFGHRRLAIIDLDERSNQPMGGRDGLIITYNGEVYNYIELRDELVTHGYEFKTESDTEVILAAYHFWGKACLDKFNGMWSFAIFDPRKNEVFVARDRFGIKPLYYTQVGEIMGFASEIKQFTTLPSWRAKANQEQLFRFIVGGEVDTTNKTMFDGVFQVMGGHFGIYDLNQHTFEINQWYSLEDKVNNYKKNNMSVEESFKSIFEDSVRLRLRSDVNVGSCLSGGMDSSAIVTMMDDLLKKDDAKTIQHTISSCFEDKAYDEQEYIDEVLKYTNTKGHKVFPNEDDLFKNIDKMIWHQDEPFGSTSIFAQWTVFDKAKKERLKVMLDGQGADEQLAGYSSFFGPLCNESLRSFRWLKLFGQIRDLKGIHNRSYLESLLYIIYSNCPEFLKRSLRFILHSKKNPWLKSMPFSFSQIKNMTIQAASFTQIKKTSLPSLLHYEDRSSMSHSIEARVPFLDYRLVEFIVSLSSEYKIKNGVTKQVLRDGLSKILPKKIKDRTSKLGFVTTERKWLKKYEDEILDLLKKPWPNYIDPLKLEDEVKKILNQSGKENFLVWRLVCVQKWQDIFNVDLV